MPRMTLPFTFKAKGFTSYEEFNQWKRDMLEDIARHGGGKWTK